TDGLRHLQSNCVKRSFPALIETGDEKLDRLFQGFRFDSIFFQLPRYSHTAEIERQFTLWNAIKPMLASVLCSPLSTPPSIALLELVSAETIPVLLPVFPRLPFSVFLTDFLNCRGP